MLDNLSVLITKFSDDYKSFSQQKQSRVADLFNHIDFTGETYTSDYINSIAKTKITKNRATGATNANETVDFTRRRVTCDTYSFDTYKSMKDIVKMAKDPEPKIIEEIVSAMARSRDESACTAFKANVDVYNQTTKAWVSTAFAGGTVPASAVELSVAKLRAAKVLMDDAEVEASGRYIVATSAQIDGLLGETSVTSADYNTVKALVQGDVDTFVGFKFVRVPFSTSGLGNPIAFQKDCMLQAANFLEDLTIGPAYSKYGDTAIICEEQYGHLRMEDAGVVEIEVATPAS